MPFYWSSYLTDDEAKGLKWKINIICCTHLIMLYYELFSIPFLYSSDIMGHFWSQTTCIYTTLCSNFELLYLNNNSIIIIIQVHWRTRKGGEENINTYYTNNGMSCSKKPDKVYVKLLLSLHQSNGFICLITHWKFFLDL